MSVIWAELRRKARILGFRPNKYEIALFAEVDYEIAFFADLELEVPRGAILLKKYI